MAGFEITGSAVQEPFLRAMKSQFVNALPSIVWALVILLVGYILGAILGHIVKRVLVHTRVIPILMRKLHLEHEEVGRWNLNELAYLIVKWYVFIIFLGPAAEVVELPSLREFLGRVALWVPNIILAVLIALAGYVMAEYIATKIRAVKSKKKSLLASSAKALTMVFVTIIALRQVGVAIGVAENAFLIVLAGIMLGLAIAFGFALRDDAKQLIKDLRKRL